MDWYAIIFDWLPTTPVYHGFDNGRLNDRSEDGASRDYSRCGRVVSEYNPATGRSREHGSWFPIKHALKFSRPCLVCFPKDSP